MRPSERITRDIQDFADRWVKLPPQVQARSRLELAAGIEQIVERAVSEAILTAAKVFKE